MRECKCGATFETLTAYRLHQRDECRFTEEVSAEGMELDQIAKRATEELLICDVCGKPNSGADAISSDTTAAGPSFTAEFTCTFCGATNENTAILE